MHELDYTKLGFKAGLEVHQQLDTGKLFCKCPSILRKDESDFTIRRKLHAVAGETGEIDISAKREAEKEKEFIYECYHDNVCLVDLDESPPNEINEEALKIALQISLLLNAKIIPITQVMRKTVVDGSNTSGFQRTIMIAHDGYVDTSYGRARIEGIYLEEDAARIIEKKKEYGIFRLDRLGIPLIEISTDPSMKNPEQVKEVALHIGNILRSCKVKRGIGTIRQDVNVNIKGHPRVELKGFQEPRMMVQVLDNEIHRQMKLIESKKELHSEVRNVLANGTSEYLRPVPGGARMYPETDLPLLKVLRAFIDDIRKNLPKLRTDIAEELKKEGLTNEFIKLILDGYLEDFENLLKVYPQDAQLIAKMLTIWRSELATKSKKDISKINEIINLDVLEKILEEVKKGKLNKNEIKPIFNDLIEGKSLADAIKKEEVEDIEEKILKIIKEKPGLSPNAYMGLVMKEIKGINGKEAMEIIGKWVK